MYKKIKKLRYLLFILSSFLFFSNVFAADVTFNIKNTDIKTYVQPIRSDMISIRDTILNGLNYNSERHDYFCIFNTSSGNPYGYCYVYNKSYNLYPSINFYGESTHSNPMFFYAQFDIKNPEQQTLTYGTYNCSTSNVLCVGYSSSASYFYSSNNLTSWQHPALRINTTSYNPTDNAFTSNSVTADKWTWIDTSNYFKFINSSDNVSSYYTITTLNVYDSNNQDLIESYSNGNFLIDKNVDFVIQKNPYEAVVNDLGDGQYSITPLNTTIYSHTSDDVLCPENTDYINDFCYINQYNYTTEEDITNDYLSLIFNTNAGIPFDSTHYYILTYRFDSNVNLIPLINSQLTISSGTVSHNANITNVKINNNGLYKDVQLVIKSAGSSTYSFALDRITLRLPSNVNLTDLNVNDFKYGLYKYYKITDFGDSIPTIEDITNDYNDNTIDSINQNNNTSWFSNFSVNTHGLSSFITSPIRLFQSLRNTTCSSVILPVPHFGNIELPCIKSIFEDNMPQLLQLYQLIMSGIICYYVGINYFRIIKNAFTPDDDRIEVQNL